MLHSARAGRTLATALAARGRRKLTRSLHSSGARWAGPSSADDAAAGAGGGGGASPKLWGGRFVGAVDPLMEKFNASISFDKKLCYVDLRGSREYARALARCGIISADEAEALCDGLDKV